MTHMENEKKMNPKKRSKKQTHVFKLIMLIMINERRFKVDSKLFS
jgi:hypothetical protein